MFDDQPDNTGSQEGSGSYEPIKVGDDEYSPDQLKSIVELGKKADEIQKTQNIDIGEMHGEFTRRSQSNAQLNQEKSEAERRVQELEDELDENNQNPDEYDDLYAENYGEPQVDVDKLVNERVAKVEAKYDKRFQEFEQKQRVGKIQEDMNSLAKTYGEIDKRSETLILQLAMTDPNTNLEDAYQYAQARKEKREKQTRGLTGSGTSAQDGVRRNDPKLSREENRRRAAEDFERQRQK